MTEFNPRLDTRATIELIAIANGTMEAWQQEAIDIAKDELRNRGITDKDQQKVLDKWKEEERQIEIAYQEKLNQNESEVYSIGKMIYIFLVAPFILIGRWRVGISLWQLKKENYQKKFMQRLLLLFGGTMFWVLIMMYGYKSDDKKRQEEIDKVDISAWEKNRNGKDSLTNESNTNNYLTK